ncbi:CHAT domain-containing protein [Piscinibacter aquaticus]|uniref:CHAT domain-containing protein n=1 Tax=Piscinibacter aquaticus TaxID=392597 RepID=A0A5C6U3S3_9BURK|nr:CHAT domain-containing protein [Piscinibacter aquaticus]
MTEDRASDSLRFVTTADRARAEETLAEGQLRGRPLHRPGLRQRHRQRRDLQDAVRNAAAAAPEAELARPARHRHPARRSVGAFPLGTARGPLEPPGPAAGGGRRHGAAAQDGGVPHRSAACLRQHRLRRRQPGSGRLECLCRPARRAPRGRARARGLRAGRLRHRRGDRRTGLGDRRRPAFARLARAALAGHGEHEFELAAQGPDAPPKRVSGMVIGRETFLTPGDVAQMRHVPELVFINCCHLGNTGGGSATYNRLAANLGVEFIRMGVRAVVCAGWAVDDAAALTFAQVFYERMLAGATFGDAVHRARATTWSAHPGVNTWGAYQCYGDPGFRLVRDDIGVERPAPPAFFAPSELVTEVNNLTESVRMISQRRERDDDALAADLRQRVDALLARVPEVSRAAWLARADVCAAIGFAYGEVRLYEPACEWLDRALRSGSGDCPVRAAEQHANFQVRLAAQAWAALPLRSGTAASTQREARRAELAERIEAALFQLDAINTRAPTYERLVLLGGACKRLAWVQQGRPRVEALLNMAQYYRQAHDIDPDDDVYAFVNWAMACLLLRRLDPERAAGDWLGALAAMCERHVAATRAALAESPSLWLATGWPTCRCCACCWPPTSRGRGTRRSARKPPRSTPPPSRAGPACARWRRSRSTSTFSSN